MDRSPSAPAEAGSAAVSADVSAAIETRASRLFGLRLRGVPVVTLLLLAFAVSVFLGNYLPTRASVAATERAWAAQQAENRSLAERVRHAEAEADRLTRDPWANERILRDDLRMSKKGEIIIR